MRARAQRERGSAALFILVLLAMMTIYLLANAAFLHTLKGQIQTVERKQVEYHAERSAGKGEPKSGTAQEREDYVD